MHVLHVIFVDGGQATYYVTNFEVSEDNTTQFTMTDGLQITYPGTIVKDVFGVKLS